MKTTAFLTFGCLSRKCSLNFLIWAMLIIPQFAQNSVSAQIFTKVSDSVFTSKKNYGYGCGFFDFNDDGKLDIIVNNRSGKSMLFKNNGNGNFSDVSLDLISPVTSNSGISFGDYDNDGYADLFLSSMKGMNSLLHNEGNGSYVRLTDNPMSRAAGFQVHCTWVDYDNDGLLDLFIPVVGNTDFQKGDEVANYMFHNQGNGRFTQVGASEPEKTPGNNVCANFSDIDNDGDMDLFMTDCQRDNNLFENKGGGVFTRIDSGGVSANTNISISCSWGDYDNDGFMDLFVANGFVKDEGGKTQSYLYHNNGNRTFTRITTGALAEFSGNTWNGLWADFDNDGDLDLFLGTLYEPDILFLNNGDGTFSKDSEFDSSSNGTSGACFGDYNNDGFLDLFTANCLGTGNPLYKNNGNLNNWLFIKCRGSVSNRSAIGARVKIKADIHGKSYWQVREINGNMGFRGLSEIRAHFGLGNAAIVDSLIIEWPSKERTVMTNLQVNKVLTVKEPVPLGSLKTELKKD